MGLILKGGPNGVDPIGMRAEIAASISISEGVFAEFGVDCIVTSIVDGEHKTNVHGLGCGVDYRAWHLPPEVNREHVRKALKAAHGNRFDCVYEPTIRHPQSNHIIRGEHFHVEVEPRNR